ncbi:MAG: hypothetical protein II888_06160 [Clostridia bacterium]|nr:hypothetical protein [Clostridia bacterium]
MTGKKPEKDGRKTDKIPDWDDGRTIAEMNVEGTSWYVPGKKVHGAEEKKREPVLTPQESRYYTWGALKAALLVTGVMCAGIALFLLFCQFIWFK